MVNGHWTNAAPENVMMPTLSPCSSSISEKASRLAFSSRSAAWGSAMTTCSGRWRATRVAAWIPARSSDETTNVVESIQNTTASESTSPARTPALPCASGASATTCGRSMLVSVLAWKPAFRHSSARLAKSLSYVSESDSGRTRVSPTTGMKFVSPSQRGTM